ncbi:MAG: DUF885 domain-containing protein [Fidelibacterota bacterium]|nr:MAG: DUF885 domain-containing protein [Candidatus Neomarinimicrobiota bacterium]
MMKSVPVILVVLSLLACNPSRQVFQELVDEFLDWHFQTSPVDATWIGVHEYDAYFSDYSKQARDEAARQIRQLQVRLSQIDPATLSVQEDVDYHILQHVLDRRLFELQELREVTWNPIPVVQEIGFGIMLLASQDFAPVSDRLPNLVRRLQDVPQVLNQAESILERSSDIHTRTAIRQVEGTMNLVSTELYSLLGDLSPEQEQALRPAADTARAALSAFQHWLQDDLLAREQRDFRLGPELYYRKLALTLGEDLVSEEIVTMAWSELHKTQQEMFVLAWPLYLQEHPSAAPRNHADTLQVIRWALDQIADDHVDREHVLENVEETIQQVTEFIQRQQIITLDPNQPLQVRITPEFQRGVSIASLEAPGPLEKGLKTYYNVSPIPADWEDHKVESFLREYNRISVMMLTIHEALPGHFVQLYYANRHPSILRSIFSSGVMVEGWATYCEKMMIQAGLGHGDPAYDLIQKKWYLRGIANAIIDPGIHAHGMTRPEVLDLLVDETFQEQSEAELKWVRAQLTSTQLSTYFVGTTLMWQLREEMEAERGDKFDLGRFHEELLSHGSPPIKHLRKLIL